MSNSSIRESVAGRVSHNGRQSWWQPRRPWYVAIVAAMAVAIAVLGYLLVERRLFPRYWTSPELGPIAVNSTRPGSLAPDGMVWIPGGTFWMGSADFSDAQPVHKVYVDGFWMDKTEVTNEQFAKFVAATGYVTLVERWPNPSKFEGFDARVFGFQPEYLAHP